MEEINNKKNSMHLGTYFEKYGMLLLLLVLFVICSLITPVFLKPGNLLNIARQISIIGIVSIGMTLVILTGGIDLSVGPILACGALLVAGLKEYGIVAAFVGPLIFGLCAGLLNGTVITKFKVQPFIVTLGAMSIYTGLGLTYSKGHPIIGTPEMLRFIGQGKVFGVIPFQAILFISVAIIIAIILKYTPFGRYTYAIGGNPEASKLSGINVDRVTIYIYGLSGLLAGFAGIIMATHLNVGEARLGTGMEMDAIAAAVIGGTSLKGGSGTIFGTVIGILVIGILSNLLNLINVPSYAQMIFKGLIIVVATVLQGLHDKKSV